jgi:hypothetical protein
MSDSVALAGISASLLPFHTKLKVPVTAGDALLVFNICKSL